MIPRPLLTTITLLACFAAPLQAAPAAVPASPAASAAPVRSQPLPPSAAASAASAPGALPSPVPPGLPQPSPAVQRAQQAQQPGTVRPEKAVVPQVAVPLRPTDAPPGAAIAASAPTPGAPVAPRRGAGDGVDERAARCLALPTKAERDRCAKDAPK